MTDVTALEKMIRESIDAINAREVERFGEFYTDWCELTAPMAGTRRGLAEITNYWTELYAASSDFRLELDHVVVSGSIGVEEYHGTGTFDGAPYAGIAATGKRFTLPGTAFVETGPDGRSTRVAVYFDGDDFARQVGALPAHGSRADKALLWALNAKTRSVRRLPGGKK